MSGRRLRLRLRLRFRSTFRNFALALGAGALLATGTVVAEAREPVGPPTDRADRLDGTIPVVDVLMLYTPRSAQEAGGEAALRGIAERAAASTNQAFINSEANVRTRIVAVAPAPDYHPAGGDEDGYGYLARTPESVARLRDTHRADVVGLFAADTGGFSTSVRRPVPARSPGKGSMMLLGHDRTDTEPDLYFGHELGHLLGLLHDGEDGEEGYGHARGYIPPSMRWRDIMAYESTCEAVGRKCPLIPYFSNPRLTYAGERLGVPKGQPGEADAVSMLNESAPIVAAYR